jgi:tetratricopeptide (TPR) repeat protein
MAEPLLTQYDGETERAQRQFDQYMSARDPWLRAIGKISHASYAVSLGTLDGAEEHCRAGLAELRALGERWGVAMALTLLADFTELRADHAASIATITEAAAIGREIGVWGDLTYVEGRLAVVHARAGDLDRGFAEIARVRRSIQARGGRVDTDRWVAFMLAELASRKGDYAEAVRCCEAVLTTIAPHEARWWQSLRAQVKARLAIAVLHQGNEDRCARLLTESLASAAAWWEHPALACVLDACAVYTLTRDRPAAAQQAARLLGAAHAIRGAFDESSLDAPSTRDKARQALGPDAFAAAYESALGSTYESALTLARAALA